MQTKCLRLMGKKLLVALTLEGKFAAEGLHDLEDDDDMLAAMARELVEKNGIGETADAIWSELKNIYEQMPTAAATVPAIDEETPTFEEERPTLDEFSWDQPSQGELLVSTFLTSNTTTTLFGQPIPSGNRKGKRRGGDLPQQPSLFSLN